MSDGTKKVEEAPCILSMREYPALYNRFSPLSTDNPRTNNDEGMQKENIDDGESGLRKQAVLLNRQRRSAAENQKESRKYTKPTTVVLGDSIVKSIKGFKMKEAINHQGNVHVYTFPGANVDDMNSHVIPTLKRNPETIILHCGTNDLEGNDSAQTVAENIAELAQALNTNVNKAHVSVVVPRGDRLNEKAKEVNEKLQRICQRRKIHFIHNRNIDPHLHLNGRILHLNYQGTRCLTNNSLRALGYY